MKPIEIDKYMPKRDASNVVEALVDAGADINTRDSTGNTKDSEGITALMIAVENGDIKNIRMLLKRKASVNIKDNNGNSALRRALYSNIGNLEEIVKLLLEHGANVRVKNSGKSPLLISPNDKITMILLNAGADINDMDKYGMSVLGRLIRDDKKDLIIECLRRGADINIGTPTNSTPLMYATIRNNIELVEMLLNAGAKVNAVNKDRYTALMYAVKRETAKLLLDYGADINAVNENGYTALMTTVLNNREEVVETLLADKNINVNIEGRDGKTALMIAKSKNHKEIIKMFSDRNIG